MSCCGKGRSQLTVTASQPAARPTTFVFEYIGTTRMSVIGPATRISYRFDRHGARVLVDGRDRVSLSTIPLLRQVGG
jgi:hypothetical protein